MTVTPLSPAPPSTGTAGAQTPGKNSVEAKAAANGFGALLAGAITGLTQGLTQGIGLKHGKSSARDEQGEDKKGGTDATDVAAGGTPLLSTPTDPTMALAVAQAVTAVQTGLGAQATSDAGDSSASAGSITATAASAVATASASASTMPASESSESSESGTATPVLSACAAPATASTGSRQGSQPDANSRDDERQGSPALAATTTDAAPTDAAPTAPAPAAPLAALGSGTASQGDAVVTRQVFPEITRLVSHGNGTHRITLQLRPAELGQVRVTMTIRDGAVRVTLTGSEQATQALASGAHELHRLLAAVGATDTQVSVRDQSTGDLWSQGRQDSNGQDGSAFGSASGGSGGEQGRSSHDSTGGSGNASPAGGVPDPGTGRSAGHRTNVTAPSRPSPIPGQTAQGTDLGVDLTF